MNRLRLLILSFSDISADARVLKQVAGFREEFEVHTCGYGSSPRGTAAHYELPLDLPVWRYDRRKIATRQYRRAYWDNPAIARTRELLIDETFDIVLANDVDAVGLALALGPRLGVHADLHEYAPRQKEDLLRWRIFVAPFIRWMCRTFVTKASSVTTVGQGIADEYRRRFGISADVVTNAAPYARLSPREPGRPIRLVHSGACLRDRNIDGIMDAVEAALPGTTLDLYLTSNDPVYLDEVRKRCQGSERLTLHDPVPYRDLARTLNAYDVGIHVLPPVNFNNAWALPNKFFDYVQARLGLIIGPSQEMARLLRDNDLGAIAADYSTAAVTAVLDGLTVEHVRSWKEASDAAATALSAEPQIAVWKRAITRLTTLGR